MKKSLLVLITLLMTLSAPSQAAEIVSLLTYNVWGLYPIAGGKAPWRYREIGQRLGDFDIVALQEAWDRRTERIVESAAFPYVARGPRSHDVVGSSGLITLSRYPIVESKFLRFNQCASFDCLAKKGALKTRLRLPDGTLLDVYNTHLNAWLQLGVDIGAAVRSKQIRSLARWIRTESRGVRYVVMGDMNAADGSGNYREMAERFRAVDLFRVVHPSPKTKPGLTYVRENPWAPNVPRLFFKSMRIDYVWAHGIDPADVSDADLVFDEPVRDDKPLSDHYGVRVTLTLR